MASSVRGYGRRHGLLELDTQMGPGFVPARDGIARPRRYRFTSRRLAQDETSSPSLARKSCRGTNLKSLSRFK
jgi:hypothetical protein